MLHSASLNDEDLSYKEQILALFESSVKLYAKLEMLVPYRILAVVPTIEKTLACTSDWMNTLIEMMDNTRLADPKYLDTGDNIFYALQNQKLDQIEEKIKQMSSGEKISIAERIIKFNNCYLFDHLVHVLIDTPKFFENLALFGSYRMIQRVRGMQVPFNKEFYRGFTVRIHEERYKSTLPRETYMEALCGSDRNCIMDRKPDAQIWPMIGAESSIKKPKINEHGEKEKKLRRKWEEKKRDAEKEKGEPKDKLKKEITAIENEIKNLKGRIEDGEAMLKTKSDYEKLRATNGPPPVNDRHDLEDIISVLKSEQFYGPESKILIRLVKASKEAAWGKYPFFKRLSVF